MTAKTAESAEPKDTLRPEYDMRGAVRGKYTDRFRGDIRMFALDPDVAAVFSDSEPVDQALRLSMKVAKAAKPAGKRKSS